MIDYKNLAEELSRKAMDEIVKHGAIVEEKIKEVITKYDCKPSDIELEVHPHFNYKIKIKASGFSFDYQFKKDLSETVKDCNQLCEHESDNCEYYPSGQFICQIDTFDDVPPNAKRKCKKCGEFYR